MDVFRGETQFLHEMCNDDLLLKNITYRKE